MEKKLEDVHRLDSILACFYQKYKKKIKRDHAFQ